MSKFLKGNYALPDTATPSRPEPETDEAKDLAQELRQRALASIGGSMVYVERTALSWDPQPSEPAAAANDGDEESDGPGADQS